MDPIMIEKLQAMKRYKMKKQLLPSLIQYSLTILFLGMFLSCPLWLPSMCSSLKNFLLVSLPKMSFFIFGPKPLFVVCNAIIVFLVGESKRSKSSPDTYDEYVNQRSRGRSTSEPDKPREGGEEMEEGQGDGSAGGLEEMEGGYEDLDGEGEKGLDELNRKVEDFIAKVNKQRMLEARMLACFG